MLTASLYILVRSTRNRIAVRLRRLREPRYLFGAIIAIAYIYFAVYRPRRFVSRRRGRGAAIPAAAAALLNRFGASLGGAAILLMAGLAWLFPGTSSLLTFTEAETDLLFPAPLSRRQLLIHRMIRSQLGLLFAAIVPAFLFNTPGTTSFGAMCRRAIALWVVLVTFRVHFAGVTMARARLGLSDSRARRAAWLPLVVTVAVLIVVAVPFAQAVLPFRSFSFTDLVTRAGTAMTTGIAGFVVLPLAALVRPLFVDGTAAFVAAMPGALLVLVMMIAWVVTSDEIFQSATEQIAAIHRPAREGRRRRASVPQVRGAGWPLALSGRAEMAFMWKNGTQTMRGLNLQSLWGPMIGVGFGVVGFTVALSQTRGLASAVCVAALMIAGATVVVGPMSVMSDLRGDLRHLELLKTWPVRGAVVVRGEILWPASLVTSVAALALLFGALLSVSAFPDLTLAWRISLWATATLAVPSLVFAQYTIHHTAAVIFPGWIPSDTEMRGFDSMGQRLILFGGVLLGLIALVLPGAFVAAIVGYVFFRLTGSPFVLVPATGLCLVIVAIELMVATEALGPIYDRLDLSGVERAE